MSRDFVDVPILRIELDHIKQTLMRALDVRHGELERAIETGIDLAYQQLPQLVAERCRGAVLNAVADATMVALRNHFAPGGEGYEQVMANLKESLKGEIR